MGAVTLPEDRGVTQGPSRCSEFTSVVVSRRPQEGWHPRPAIEGNAASPAIETLECRSTVESFERSFRADEAHGRRARENALVAGEEKALERKPGAHGPSGIERFRRAAENQENPTSAAGRNTPARFRVEQDVEGATKPRGRNVPEGWIPSEYTDARF